MSAAKESLQSSTASPVHRFLHYLLFNFFAYRSATHYTLHYTTLHYTTLHYTVLHYTTLYYTTLHYTTLHCITLHYTTLHYITLHYTTLHYTTLHYITSHHITSHHILFTTSCYTVLTGEAVAVLASWWLSVWSEDRDGRSPWSVAREHRIYVAIVHFSTPTLSTSSLCYLMPLISI